MIKKLVSKIHPVVLLSIFYFLFSTVARADLPVGNAITLDEVDSIAGTIARFMISISVVCAVIFIILSGIMMMAAQSNPEAFSKAQQSLKVAIYGTFVVLGVGVIMNTIAALVTRDFFCRLSVLGICLY